jgi:aminopeptidase
MRTIIAHDDGAARLGEVALVDDEGRIGALDTVFYDTLLDENAASHLALGRAFPFLAADEEAAARMNESDIHIDFMIGTPELTVTAVDADGGDPVPVLAGGKWRV